MPHQWVSDPKTFSLKHQYSLYVFQLYDVDTYPIVPEKSIDMASINSNHSDSVDDNNMLTVEGQRVGDEYVFRFSVHQMQQYSSILFTIPNAQGEMFPMQYSYK